VKLGKEDLSNYPLNFEVRFEIFLPVSGGLKFSRSKFAEQNVRK
jgi:hypothetical protein